MSLALPQRASLQYLKRLAKERVTDLRATNPTAKLADAQRHIARQYGFSSWRALKAEIDRRHTPQIAAFAQACARGDVDAIRALLRDHPHLAREQVMSGSTGLHLAIRHPQAMQILIEHGADPNARDTGDNATPLHFAAGQGLVDSVRVLLNAGADVHGVGDAHHGGVIGWASRVGNEEVIDLLLKYGARHHIFSAIALGDVALVEALVRDDQTCLTQRRSRFENGQTPLHAAVAPPDGLAGEPNYAMLQRLIELGADLEATDGKRRTALEVVTLRGDQEAIRLLRAAGAIPTAPRATEVLQEQMRKAATSVKRCSPMFRVRDMRETVRWYESIGFKIADQYEENGELLFASVCFGEAQFTLSPGSTDGPRDVSLWFFTDHVQELYKLLRERQLLTALPEQGAPKPEVRFDEDLYEPFYGGRQFSIRDINGLSLVFWQPA
jgi:ankyrin repeat protein/catechol 2,3-dioxygenase-like lactoylglutathione lyase family enzyme